MSKIQIPVVTIDTGVPIPQTGQGRKSQWPIEDLKVGESFVFPLEKRRTLASMVSRVKATEGKEYTIKKMDDSVCRIWRTK